MSSTKNGKLYKKRILFRKKVKYKVANTVLHQAPFLRPVHATYEGIIGRNCV